MKKEDIKKAVRESYGKVAASSTDAPCCGSRNKKIAKNISKTIGYTDEDIESAPEGANLGLGCGNPVALASLKEGDTVLDLGSGAGFDCFLAAKKVGARGKVIGVDMTPEMIEKARENANKSNIRNVEFRLGEIEKMPVEDSSVDVIISNCVINLSPDKGRVFREAYRVLRPGGMLMVSDIVLLKEIPKEIKESVEVYAACIGGATTKEKYIMAVKNAGFRDVRIMDEVHIPVELLAGPAAKAIMQKINLPAESMKEIVGAAASVKVQGIK